MYIYIYLPPIMIHLSALINHLKITLKVLLKQKFYQTTLFYKFCQSTCYRIPTGKRNARICYWILKINVSRDIRACHALYIYNFISQVSYSTWARRYTKHDSRWGREHVRHISMWTREHVRHVSTWVREHARHAGIWAHKHTRHVW